MGSNNPMTRKATVVVESLVSSLIATKQSMIPAKSNQHKKRETAEGCKPRRATEAVKKSAKTKATKPLPEAGDRLTES